MKGRLYYIAMAISVMAAGCNKIETNPDSVFCADGSEGVIQFAEPRVFTTSHDIQINELAYSVHRAISESRDLRRFIHSEALLRQDGGYEFLISGALDKPIKRFSLKRKTQSSLHDYSFGEILQEYLPVTKSGSSLLEELQAQYPDLQVAIPVHADEWDPDTYIPMVVFETEDYDDATTLSVPGYDSEGHYIEVDAVNEPDVPVIVISHNEGLQRMPSTDDASPNAIVKTLESAPYDLTAEPTSNGIVLSWKYDDAVGSGYRVWRKGPNETKYKRIASLTGLYNIGYQDTQVAAGMTYQYYVTVYQAGAQSEPSNYVTVVAPQSTSSLTGFKEFPSGLQVECEWTNGQSSYADVVLEHKGPDDSSYSILNRTTDWSTNYCFTPLERGRRHNFRAYRDNGNSYSDARTDFIYPPYRNTNDISYVYLKKITYPRGLEGWLRGDAEFDIVITYYNALSNSVQADSLFLRTASGDPLSVLFKEWRCQDVEKDWYSLMSIHMIEQDPGAEVSVKLGVKKGKKDGNGVWAEVTAQYNHIMLDGDDNCGSRDLFYYDNPEQILQFPLEGVEITISGNR